MTGTARTTDRTRTAPPTPAVRTRRVPRALRLAGPLAAGTLMLAGLLTPAAAASAPAACAGGSGSGARLCAAAGDLVDVTLGELHPTQSTLGFDQIYYKLDRYGSDKDEQNGDVNKRFDDFCETNGQDEADKVPSGARLSDPSSFTCKVPVGEETDDTRAGMKTVVIGPGGALYLTDGHHSLTSFLETPDGGPDMHIRLKVAANLSDLSQDEFWATMEDRDWVWLHDENGDPITPAQLPQHLGLASFHDDRYRSLVYFTRDIGYTAPDDAAEFLEFLWGSWLRGKVDLDDYDLTDRDSYLDAVKDASEAMTDADKDTVIADGRTAGELGRLDEWNDGKDADKGEFDDLGKPLSNDEPGKLAYALDYRGRL
ncbi:ParB/Srx family N-terminal domain-containing protein [Streptomyces sp. TS71-3]|uniref:ParB/Srx family N-terminal domain-containing protein n=1 Tax=Streptomyces sp. TS71-3 TaxID=2733862 RepID=UPI001B2ACF8E|nr:lipoprotein [Streptomyces sp. TS71-3]